MIPPRVNVETVRQAMGEYADPVASREERGQIYQELLGFVPPRIEARLNVTGALDPKMLDLQEQLRNHGMYPKSFDVKTAQLMLFGMLLMDGSDAAILHGIAARRAGASWHELQDTINLCFLFRGLSAANRGAEILANIAQREEQAQQESKGCETCRAFYPLVKRIVDSHQGKVQLVVRLVPFHKGSDVAAKILIAAHKQKLFFPVTEVVLNSQDAWAAHDNPNPERIWTFLKGTSLDAAKAKQDAGSPEAQAVLDQDMADASTLQVTKTPGFFVNGRPLKDFGHEQLKALVEEEVKRVYAE